MPCLRCVVKNTLSLLLWVMALLLLPGCRPPESEKVIILCTGRMAGNAYPQEVQHIAPLQHYAYLAGYVKQVRTEASARGARVLLIDSGDSLGGSFAAHATGSMNMVHLFNALAYDAVFLGNLDPDVPPAALAALQMPVLCPFTDAAGKPAIPSAPPVARIEKEGLRIDLLANFYGTVEAGAQPQRFPMWYGLVNEPVRTIRDYRPWRPDPAPDLTLLNWMKFESGKTPTAEERQLIEETGTDAILAHKVYSQSGLETWEQPAYPEWPVPVSQNILRSNRGFTLTRLELVRSGNQWKASSPPALIQLTANTAAADPGIVSSLSQFTPQIQSADRELGHLPKDLPAADFLDAYLMILARQTGADVVICSKNSIRDQLEAGRLKASQLYNVLPWTNDLERFSLSAAQFEQLKTLPELRILRREQLPATIQIVSSRFFARLIARELSLDPGSLRAAGTAGEFDSLSTYLAEQGIDGLVAPPALPGWVLEGPRQ